MDAHASALDLVLEVSDLKPCPFCGTYPVAKSHELYHPRTQAPAGYRSCAMEGWTGPIEEWNRRAHDATETAALRKVRDEMAEELKLLRSYAVDEYDAVQAVLYSRWLAALDAILEARKI